MSQSLYLHNFTCLLFHPLNSTLNGSRMNNLVCEMTATMNKWHTNSRYSPRQDGRWQFWCWMNIWLYQMMIEINFVSCETVEGLNVRGELNWTHIISINLMKVLSCWELWTWLIYENEELLKYIKTSSRLLFGVCTHIGYHTRVNEIAQNVIERK